MELMTDVLATQDFSVIALAKPITSEAEAKEWREHLDFMNSSTEQKPALLIVPFADLVQARTFANYTTVKTCWQMVAVCYHGAINAEHLLSASIAAEISAESDPALPFNGIELKLPVVADKYRLSNTDIERGLQMGIAMVALNSNDVPSIVRLISTYRVDKDGNADDLMLDVNAALVVRYLRRIVRRTIKRNPRRKNTEAQRKNLRRELIAVLKKVEDAEIIENFTGNEKALTVEQNPNIKTDVKVRIPAYWVRGMHVVDAYIDVY